MKANARSQTKQAEKSAAKVKRDRTQPGSTMTKDLAEHAAKVGSLPRLGRSIPLSITADKMKLIESFTDAKLRRERAQALIAETELELKKLNLETERGTLVTTDAARAAVEEAHVEWTDAMDKLVEAVVKRLDAKDVDVSTRDTLREVLDAEIIAMRERIADGK